MAATLRPSQNDPAASIHASTYRQSLMTNLDFRDSRYPTVSSTQSRLSQRQSLSLLDPSTQQDSSYDPSTSPPHPRSADTTNVSSGQAPSDQQPSSSQSPSQGWASQGTQSNLSPPSEPSRASLSYALPSGASRRVVERYSLGEEEQEQESQPPPNQSEETRQTAVSAGPVPRSKSSTPQPNVRLSDTQDPPAFLPPGSPRHPAVQVANVDSRPPSGPPDNSPFSPPIMPLPTSVNYTPPVAPRNRTYPQQPTYINVPPQTPVNPMNTLQSTSLNPPMPREEVCVECAMRDQEMADVDVTSPGVWDRESDVAYEELKRREMEEEAKGVISPDSSRPRARGGRLTEHNLRLWLSINPKEPASKQQTLAKYVKAQRALLHAEAHAHAQAMQEARQLDNKVRDAYTQLRSSAYDLGNHAALADDLGGVRIKPPQSHTPGMSHSHNRSQSREITLLENGMIVEHVDVRKEEREARERRRKEERRARKSSRSSAVEVTSIISGNSNGLLTDNGGSLKPYSRYSQASSARPMSILTAPNERPDLPRAYSQASFSDVHSLGSGSPRRRFFGFKNLSAGWRSQDSLTPSAMTGGSMIDMHVALQRESNRSTRYFSGTAVDLNSPRRSQFWTPIEPEAEGVNGAPVSTYKGKGEGSNNKKKNGFAKIWRIMTGQNKHNDSTHELGGSDKADDYLPLAPPPPLSYLVDRGTPEMAITGGGRQQQHSPAISVSSTLPKFGFGSPPTAPSSSLPSPVSSRPPGPSLDVVEIRNSSGDEAGEIRREDEGLRKNIETSKVIYPTISTPDIRQSIIRASSPLPPLPSPQTNQVQSVGLSSREKSLPPLPPGEEPAPTSASTATPVRVIDRPRTVYTYDPRPLPPGTGPAHDFLPPNAPFRTADMRRQSFNGLSSNPNLFVVNEKSATYNPRLSFNPRYDEFGLSRRSLGRLDDSTLMAAPTRNLNPPAAPSTKRKSKFGLSSLLGRKHNKSSQDMHHEKPTYLFPSTSDGQDEWGAQYTTSNSRHSVFSVGTTPMSAPLPAPAPHFQPRMSIASRRPLEDLVSQDPEFVAYRYPSKDQTLDLFR